MTYQPRYPMGGIRNAVEVDSPGIAREVPDIIGGGGPSDNPSLDDALDEWGATILELDIEARRLEAAGVVDSSIVDALFGVVRGWRTQIGSVTGERPPTIDVDVAR